MLIEKAWAKVHQSYSNIVSGTPREVIRALTGCPTLSIKTDAEDFESRFAKHLGSKSILTSGSLSEESGISKA
jgi:calpain-15